MTHAAEPLKNGATAMPGVAGPEAMPAAAIAIPVTNGAAASPAIGGVRCGSGSAATTPAAKRQSRSRKDAGQGQGCPAENARRPSPGKSPAKAVAAKAAAAAAKTAAAKPAARKTKAAAT